MWGAFSRIFGKEQNNGIAVDLTTTTGNANNTAITTTTTTIATNIKHNHQQHHITEEAQEVNEENTTDQSNNDQHHHQQQHTLLLVDQVTEALTAECNSIYNREQNHQKHQQNQHHHRQQEKQQEQNMEKNSQDMTDTLETKQARHKSCVKWILSKAFNNRVPENLKEPFYRDHEGQEHIKPQIVVGLGNASLYCQTLSNLYSDPNYQTLNHWSILQTLTRKNVPVGDSPDQPLTETVLIQTNPLRINAHMSVIEALMILYAKEVATSERISSAIGRISGGILPKEKLHHEPALLCWVSHACAALKKRIDQEIEGGATDENGARLESPDIPPLRDYRDLCDGICLAFLISYYCPKVVPWTSVRVSYLPTVEDSIFNVLLVSNFSQKHLPYTVFHMTPQDITYMRGSMKQNLVVLLADFFNLFEIHPTKSVCYPGMEQHHSDVTVDDDDDLNNHNGFINVSVANPEHESGVNEHGIAHRRGLTCPAINPIPDLRSGLDDIPTMSTSSSSSPLNKQPFQVTNRAVSASTVRRPTPPRDSAAVGTVMVEHTNDEGFVVHRGRTIPTLASMQEPLVPARMRQSKEKINTDSKSDERGDNQPMATAGRPSNWEDTRRPSYAGRRSRRNSFTEDSQLTIENFGGSQDQLNMIGRTMERERKFSNSTINNVTEPAVAVRSSIADARGTLQIGYENDSGSEKQDRETEKISLRRQTSMDNISLRNIIHSNEKDMINNSGSSTSGGNGGGGTSGINNLAQNDNETPQRSKLIGDGIGNSNNGVCEDTSKRKTSFATLPNTTTWQQQSVNYQQSDIIVDEERPLVDATKLSTIRMKLEEKRRHIEQEKRKMEFAFSKQQAKVGKAAFLQAINKQLDNLKTDQEIHFQRGNRHKPSSVVVVNDDIDRKNDVDVDDDEDGGNIQSSKDADAPENISKSERPCSLQDLSDINNIETKWDPQIETKKTPELEHMDIDQYQESIAIMNSSLKDIQKDIHRLTNQQSQMHAQHIQASQLMQAQQIANMINNQYGGSHRHIPGATPSTVSANFGGSTPHLSQQQQQQQQQQPFHHLQHHQTNPQQPYQQHQPQQQIIHDQYSMIQPHPPVPQPISRTHQYVNEQGQYILGVSGSGGGVGVGGNNSRDGSPFIENGNHHHHHHQPQQQQQLHRQNSQPQYSNYTTGESSLNQQQYQTYRIDHHHHQQQQQQHRENTDSPQPNQFYLHDSSQSSQLPQTPQPPTRRTWAQSSSSSQSPLPLDINAWSQNSPKLDTRTWKSSASSSPGGQTSNTGFMLHQNGGGGGVSQNEYPADKTELHKSYQNLFPVHESPQHSRVHRQISQIIGFGGESKSHIDLRGDGRDINPSSSSGHSPRVPMSPPIDDMAPQSISFIGDEDVVDQSQQHNNYRQNHHHQQQLSQQHHNYQQQNLNADVELDIGKLNIKSGKLTYRIPSPTRPSLNMNSFQDPNAVDDDDSSINNEQKGFYIAFDNAQPKRPKPPLRTKRSPKKERSIDSNEDNSQSQTIATNGKSKQEQIRQLEKELLQEQQQMNERKHLTYSPYDKPTTTTSNNIFGTSEESYSSRHFNNQNNNASGGNDTISRRHISDNQVSSILDRRHLEDVTNHHQLSSSSHMDIGGGSGGGGSGLSNRPKENKLIIDDELKNLDPDSVDEMERKKEKIMLLSLQRRQQQEEAKARKEIDAMQRREREREKQEERDRKREEQVARRAAILEQHKFKKAIEEAEQKGLTIDRNDLMIMKQQLAASSSGVSSSAAGPSTGGGGAKMRSNRVVRPRPKTIHVESGSVDLSEASSSLSSRNKKGSNSNLTGIGQLSSNSMRRDYYRGSQDSLAIRESPDEYPSTSSTPIGRRGSYKTSREPTVERGRTISRISVAKGSNLNFRGRKSNSLMNLCDTDSGLGRATPPRRAPSPGMGPSGRHLPSPSGPGSLPPGFMNKRRIFDDGSSDISSAASSMMEYSGPKLYKQPATKSNRGIILNAVEYCVFPGVVNRDAKQKVLEKIARSEAKHFLVLFRDAGCQFRALYSYWPENETVHKLYGTGPNQVDEFMFDKFFKYNSGGKCFSQVHTKHLTVTIDAFTIHNSLWQGKKVNMPSKRDMTLVI